MFVVGVYDIHVKRVGKIKKVFDKYMFWQQNSVFEGELSDGQYRSLVSDIQKVIKPDEDFIIFYRIPNKKWLKKDMIGKEKNPFDFLI